MPNLPSKVCGPSNYREIYKTQKKKYLKDPLRPFETSVESPQTNGS
jgi:hypothetical protein